MDAVFDTFIILVIAAAAFGIYMRVKHPENVIEPGESLEERFRRVNPTPEDRKRARRFGLWFCIAVVAAAILFSRLPDSSPTDCNADGRCTTWQYSNP